MQLMKMAGLLIKNTQDLLEYMASGQRVKYIFFWGHRKTQGSVSKSCLSQWYDAPFTSDGNQFQTVEHFMMFEKAKLFGDMHKASQILAAQEPGKAKALGREVLNFDQAVWDQNKFQIVVRGNYEKFTQTPDLKEFLINTGARILVEASPVDPIWGIGLAADDPDAENPRAWQGQNLLGFALMEVRRNLMGA